MKTEHEELLVEAKKSNEDALQSALSRAAAASQASVRSQQINKARLAAATANMEAKYARQSKEATRRAASKSRHRQVQEINPETQWVDDEGMMRGAGLQQTLAMARYYNTTGKSAYDPLTLAVKKQVAEEAPANAMGTAGISGAETAVDVGIAGRDKLLSPGILRRPPPKMFGGKRVFTVPSSDYYKATLGKKKGQHWRSMVNGPLGEEIRQYALENKNAPIIVEDETTGAMMYLRYGK